MKKKLLIKGTFILRKFQGKGAWTFVDLPTIKTNPNTPFGWLEVMGKIEDYSLEHHKLMPKGDGTLFLPVKQQIRKSINKYEGDRVYLELYEDNREIILPKELKYCLQDEDSSLLPIFESLPTSERNSILKWILGAKSHDLAADRINKLIIKLKNLSIE